MQDAILTNYYHSVLDGAIFDGRLRIYYSQDDESPALRLYFEAQNIKSKTVPSKYSLNTDLVFVYLYPEDFKASNIPNFDKGDIQVRSKDQNTYILVRWTEKSTCVELVKLIEESFSEMIDASRI